MKSDSHEWSGKELAKKAMQDLAMLIFEMCLEHKGDKEIGMVECDCGKLLALL